MHTFDRDGWIHEYRVARAKRERNQIIAFTVGCIVAGVIIVCGATIVLSVVGR